MGGSSGHEHEAEAPDHTNWSPADELLGSSPALAATAAAAHAAAAAEGSCPHPHPRHSRSMQQQAPRQHHPQQHSQHHQWQIQQLPACPFGSHLHT
jgi:hypothetical protein